MRFQPHPRITPYRVTPRKLENHRRKVLSRLPWSLAAMAAYQPDLAAEAASREAWARDDMRDRRAARCREWRAVRSRLCSLPPSDKAAIKARWAAWNGPLRPDLLAYLIRRHLEQEDGRGQDR